MVTTGMVDQRDIERELGEAGLDPRIDHEHKAALHAELKARLADRKSSRPLVAIAIAVVTLGATFANQPALESTGLSLDVMQVNDDGTAFLSSSQEAKSSFGFSRSTADGVRVPYTSTELESLRVSMEELQQSYLEGLLPLARAFGLSYGGNTEYYLAYGLDQAHTFPVSIGEIEDNEQLREFFRGPRYREICVAAYRGTLGPAPTDTIMLNGSPVAFSSWQFDVPECGVITFHKGTPLN
jgi:hypothetical protein